MSRDSESTRAKPGALDAGSLPASVSIVVPTHDRSDALRETLEVLGRVEVPSDTRAEILVVANGCSDGTSDMVRRMAIDYPLPLRCIEEAVGNLNVARNRGCAAASGDIIAFLDDDVSVDRGWLRGIVETFATLPVDLLAGRVTLAYEIQPPDWVGPAVEQLLSRLDLGDQSVELRSAQLVGANFAVRRHVLEKRRFRPELDRAGRHLLSGGDTELATRALADGCRIFYSPAARVVHRIPAARLEQRYLSRLAFGRGRTRCMLSRVAGEPSKLVLLRLGAGQLLGGVMGEAAARLSRDVSGATAARVLWMRGLGLLTGVAGAA